MKRGVEEVEMEGTLTVEDKLVRQLVFNHNLLNGELIERWRFAVTCFKLCRALRYNSLVRHAIQHYCTDEAVADDFMNFMRKNTESFPGLRIGCYSSIHEDDDMTILGAMLMNWIDHNCYHTRYIGQPSFKELVTVKGGWGVTFNRLYDITWKLRAMIHSKDVFLTVVVSTAVSCLVFIHHMLTKMPNEQFFVCVHHTGWVYLFVDPVTQTADRFFPFEMEPQPQQTLLENCHFILSTDFSGGRYQHDLALQRFEEACLKAGGDADILGYFLSRHLQVEFDAPRMLNELTYV